MLLAPHARLLERAASACSREEVFEAEGAEEEYRNALNFGFIYVHSILREVETLPEEGASELGDPTEA